MPTVPEFDCAIVGGGPAGATLAWLLAGRNVRVLLLDDGRHQAPAPRETLLAAARAGLERAGLWSVVESAAVPDPRRHGAIWGSAELRWRQPGDAGLLLERGVFDQRLRQAAAGRGAMVVEGARVRGPLPSAGTGEVRWRCAGGSEHTAHAQCFVVATGRRSRSDLVPLHDVQRGCETAAITVLARQPAFAGTAVVEAVAEGWWWWIGDGRDGGAATLLCDVGELTAVGTRALCARALRQAHGPLHAATDVRLVHATRATARVQRAASAVLLLGDAAATIDPLASQGVEKALAAADHAAAAVTARCAEPAWWPRLLELHARWELGLHNAHGAVAQSFLQRETRFPEAVFWRSRQHGIAPAAAPPPTAGPLVCAPQVVTGPVLARADRSFVEAEGATHAGRGDTLTHVGYVPVAPLLRAFAAPRTLAEGVAAAGREPRLFVLPPRVVQEAAAQLVRFGWIIPADGATGTP